MVEEEIICPYTGLRSFTEEESLYFKGREEQINQVITQLEEKKFLMVTGASGDGKSSLIFAGLIPQARAGFFKARYSNWHIADFRPERSPLKNMATSLSIALKQDASIIETELSRGFSSLVELYKSSIRYTDINGAAYQGAAEDEQRRMERESGNLLILIDQFEEFFTNPENFPGGVPSQESRLLLNIVLETAKISLKEDLPIYIVCTMRSDYIGQCAAFRGLPEFIGFSQFFVPRLQRKELYQVIEEPAILSGNRISKRLIDRLISDVEEGTDHLPILQHALKEIWKAASNGQDEMDLLHYAMVGGMHGDHLPKEVREKFQTWKNQLPQHEKDYLNNPGLANVLDIHANKLYEGAAVYCAEHGHPEITAKQARFIIAMSFACLTRIDENRAVRNRMTLQEITQIINVPQHNAEVVGTVLSIFREPGNTLVRPFIQEGDVRRAISPDDVFDITHEALIRNWKLLKKWADQEFEYFNTFLDFQKQVNRWKEHGKSDDFLLPIGPLTYFESWYKKCRPNQYWINRYHTTEERKIQRLKQSVIVLKNGKEYLRKSSLKLFVTRTVMKYGAGRIAAVVGLFAFMVLSGFGIYTWRTRQNDNVIESILKEGEILLQDRELISFDHAYFTAEAERTRPGYFKQVLRALPEQQRINVASNFVTAFFNTELKNPPAILRQSILWTDSLVRAFGNKMDSANVSSLNQHLINLNALTRNLSYYLFYNPDEALTKLRNENARFQARIIQELFKRVHPLSVVDMKALHIAITDAMNYRGFSEDERTSFIAELSPLSGREQVVKKFSEWFPAGEKISAGVEENFSHKGGYQMLAYWYASLGDVQRTLQCLDSLKKYNQNYDKIDINSTHVSAYFLMYGRQDAFRQFAKIYSSKINIPVHRYSNMLLDKVGFIAANTFVKFIKAGNLNDNFVFLPDSIRNQLFQICREFSKTELKSVDALNFNLALLAKQEGIFAARRIENLGAETPVSDSLFNVSLSFYNKVSSSFLNEKIEVESQTTPYNTEKRIIPRRYIYLYPGLFKTVEPFMAASATNYYNDSFFHFMLSKNLFAIHYKGQENYQLITDWVSTYFTWYQMNIGRVTLNYPDPGQSTFLKIDSLVARSGFDLDDDWVKMVLIRNYLDVGDTLNAYQRVRQLKIKTLEKSNTAWPFRNMIINVAAELAMRDKRKESMSLISNFANRKNRIKAFGQVAFLCQLDNKQTEAAVFFDSANTELSRLKRFDYNNNDFRLPLVGMLALQNSSASEKKALEYIGSMQWYNRSLGIYTMSTGYAHMDEFYKATRVVPVYASYYDKVYVFLTILFEENIKKGNNGEGWESYVRLMKANVYSTGSTQNDLLPD